MGSPARTPFQPTFNYLSNKLYQHEAYPVLISCTFTVAKADTAGLGITGLTGGGVANVFMGTSATPGAGNYGVLNPNPADGTILVQLQNNFNQFLNAFSSMQSPVTGLALTATAAGTPYIITDLGTATAADWLAAGFPPGMTPAVGASFVAIATGTIGGSAKVKAVGASGVVAVEVMGNPNLTLKNSAIYQNGGGILLFQALDKTDAPVAPAEGTVVTLSMYLSNSSVKVAGQ